MTFLRNFYTEIFGSLKQRSYFYVKFTQDIMKEGKRIVVMGGSFNEISK